MRARTRFLLLIFAVFPTAPFLLCSHFLTLLIEPKKLHSDRSDIQFLPNDWRLQVHSLGQGTTPCMLGTCERPELESFLEQCILFSTGGKKKEATKKVAGSRWRSTRVQFSWFGFILILSVRGKEGGDTCILASLKLNSILAETRTEESSRTRSNIPTRCKPIGPRRFFQKWIANLKSKSVVIIENKRPRGSMLLFNILTEAWRTQIYLSLYRNSIFFFKVSKPLDSSNHHSTPLPLAPLKMCTHHALEVTHSGADSSQSPCLLEPDDFEDNESPSDELWYPSEISNVRICRVVY